MIWHEEQLEFEDAPQNMSITLLGNLDNSTLSIDVSINLLNDVYTANFYRKIISKGLAYEDITAEMIYDKYESYVIKIKDKLGNKFNDFIVRFINKLSDDQKSKYYEAQKT